MLQSRSPIKLLASPRRSFFIAVRTSIFYMQSYSRQRPSSSRQAELMYQQDAALCRGQRQVMEYSKVKMLSRLKVPAAQASLSQRDRLHLFFHLCFFAYPIYCRFFYLMGRRRWVWVGLYLMVSMVLGFFSIFCGFCLRWGLGWRGAVL